MSFKKKCDDENIVPLLDIGKQPISNRFLRNLEEPESLYPLSLGQCEKNGLLCLMDPVTASELIPRFDWITYAEPEPHLDHTVDLLCKLEGIHKSSVVGGISFKDDSTLERFEKRGFKTWRIDAESDLGISTKGAGVESIQDALTPDKSKPIVERHGKADILIVRHIFEHVYDLEEFTETLKQLINDNGYIIFEVPDCSQSVETCDYTMLWEEHLLYFTPNTIKSVLVSHGLEVVHFENYPYPMENSLVAVTQLGKKNSLATENSTVQEELNKGKRYAQEFGKYQKQFVQFFEKYSKNTGKIAFLGAGHLACTFIWAFQLQQFVECIIDDNPNKQGLFMPASHLPIVSSQVLNSTEISLCMLGLNPLNEEKVIANNSDFLSKGGRFLSIFPASSYSIYNSDLP
jgi:hypothetical protein